MDTGIASPRLRIAVALTVNGRRVSAEVEPRMHLGDFLREQLNLTGTHLGCEQGVCGACTVLVDGTPQRSCIAYAVECDGAQVTTIEGFDADPTMAALREAFAAHHGLQCGFCTPGMLIASRDIVLRLGDVPETRIREELSGNLCRCTGYVGIVEAVAAVAAGREPAADAAAVPVQARVAAPADASVAPASVAAAPAALAAGGAGIAQTIALGVSADAAWAVLSDPRAVAACLPGAELTALEGEAVSGVVRVALGPIKVALAGQGSITLDQAARSGVLVGRGRDGGTGSSAEGEVRWQVVPRGEAASELRVELSWRLSGALAQFSRGAVVEGLVRRLAADFAANLEARVAGQAPPAAQRELGLLALIWAVIKARLFR